MTKAKIKRNANVVHRVVIFLIWVSVIISDCYCVWRNFLTDNLFMAMFDVMAFIMWCMLCKNEKKYINVVRAVKQNSKSSKFLRLSSIICISLILVIIMTSVMITLQDFVFLLGRGRCGDMWNFVSNEKLNKALLITQQAFRQFFIHGLIYFVTAFFFYICMELNSSVDCLIDDTVHKHCTSEDTLYYINIIKALHEIEEAMCSSISVVLAIAFGIFFRVVVAFLFNPILQSVSYMAFNAATYLLGSFVSFISVVVAADKLQSNIRKLRRMKLNNFYVSRSNSYDLDDMTEEFLTLMEDRGSIALTAWKTFHIQRGLLLTAAASLISYSVIIGQLD